jgi:hypothetical protein
MRDNGSVSDDRSPASDVQPGLVEFICLDKHVDDPVCVEGFCVTVHRDRTSYCARGAERNHVWVRVPATPLQNLTLDKMEERPPDGIAPASG